MIEYYMKDLPWYIRLLLWFKPLRYRREVKAMELDRCLEYKMLFGIEYNIRSYPLPPEHEYCKCIIKAARED